MIELKKRLTSEYQNGRDIKSILLEFNEFSKKLEVELLEFRKSQINILEEKEKNRNYLYLFDDDKAFVDRYDKIIKNTRPNDLI